MRNLRVPIGLAFWCGALAMIWFALAARRGETQPVAREYLSNLWASYSSSRNLEVILPESCVLAAGDPVFAAETDGSLRQVGIVLGVSGKADRLAAEEKSVIARAALFPSAPELKNPIRVRYLSPPDSINWVVETLLPPERKRMIEEELTSALREHHEEILSALGPVVDKSVRDGLVVLQQDLMAALKKHQAELQAIVGRGKEEILKRDLLPLVKSEVWPIVRKDSEPLFRQVSGELWERVSLWSLAWRGTTDKMPLLRGRNRLEGELLRFLDQEAVPILERHQDDFLAVLESIMQDVVGNERVRAAFNESAAKVAADPELQGVLNAILREAVVKNPRFWQAMRENLNSVEARDALRLTGARLEPALRRIGELMLGTREGGLTPEFNQVLRHQILLKDRHGILVGDLPGSSRALPGTILEASFSGTSP
jgi:hypothetical protein